CQGRSPALGTKACECDTCTACGGRELVHLLDTPLVPPLLLGPVSTVRSQVARTVLPKRWFQPDRSMCTRVLWHVESAAVGVSPTATGRIARRFRCSQRKTNSLQLRC